jgi:alpha-glucosidase
MSPWEADALAAAIEAAVKLTGRSGTGAAWVLSNHDFGRLGSRYGVENERAAAVLLMTLPGTAFVYQGDEIGMLNGPGSDPPHDRLWRDSFRHPMQWDRSPNGGFTTGDPWLPVVDPAERNVSAQRRDPSSLLELHRRLIALKHELDDSFRLVGTDGGVLAYERAGRLIAVNTTGEARQAPGSGTVAVATHNAAQAERGTLEPHAAAVYC